MACVTRSGRGRSKPVVHRRTQTSQIDQRQKVGHPDVCSDLLPITCLIHYRTLMAWHRWAAAAAVAYWDECIENWGQQPTEGSLRKKNAASKGKSVRCFPIARPGEEATDGASRPREMRV